MDKKENQKEILINGYCSPKCIYYEVREMPSYTSPTHKSEIQLCTYGGNARSFGCMNGCLNGKPEYKEEENGITTNN